MLLTVIEITSCSSVGMEPFLPPGPATLRSRTGHGYCLPALSPWTVPHGFALSVVLINANAAKGQAV